jgi:hypothetical protein
MCGSDEPHPYPARSFTYLNEQARTDEEQSVIVYNRCTSQPANLCLVHIYKLN